jgi:hypothetical protein
MKPSGAFLGTVFGLALVAAIVSVGMTWLTFSSRSSSDGNRLIWTVLMSAAAAGLVGSRMASGEVEKDVLWDALAASAERPLAPGLGKLVDDAKTPLDAAAIATGQSVPGVKPPKEMNLVRRTADIEADLLRHLDRPTESSAWRHPARGTRVHFILIVGHRRPTTSSSALWRQKRCRNQGCCRCQARGASGPFLGLFLA